MMSVIKQETMESYVDIKLEHHQLVHKKLESQLSLGNSPHHY